MEKHKKDLSKGKTKKNNSKTLLVECQKLKEEYLNNWKRSEANLLNYKKEENERFERLVDFAVERILLDMLVVADNFESAEKNIPDEEKNNKYIKGFLQIKRGLDAFLKNNGVEKIMVVGRQFNPNLCEAAGEEKRKDAKSGVVIEEIRAGYVIKGKLLRPARVRIAK